VAVMNKGVIEQLGSPSDLYERPRTVFVASFVGSANILDSAAKRALHLSGACDRTVMVRREAVLVRAGSFDADEPQQQDVCSRIRGKCERSLFMGDRCEVTMRIDDNFVLRGVSPVAITPGTPVWADLDLSTARILEQ